MKTFLIFCMLLYLSFAVLILVIGVTSSILQWLAIGRLGRTPCPECGELFGKNAVTNAREEYYERVGQLLSDALKRGVRLRLAPAEWTIRCPSCGNNVYYRPEKDELSHKPRHDAGAAA